MTLELNFEGFEKYLIDENIKSLNDVQYVFKFPNGYGASVIKNKWSYGHRADLYCFQKYPSIRFSTQEIDCFEYVINSIYFGEDFEKCKYAMPYEMPNYGMPLKVLRRMAEKWKEFLERKGKCSI